MADVAVASSAAPAEKKTAAQTKQDDDSCPKCYRTKALHTNMKFMVSACGHRLYVECRCASLVSNVRRL